MLKLFRLALTGFGSHQGFFLAAGLSFYSLICLVPLLFLVVSLAGFILSKESASRYLIGQLTQVVPVYQAEISQFFSTLVQTRRVSGVLGTLILVVFSTQLFASIRLVLNRILEVSGRGFWRGMLFDSVMILLISIFFFATTGITAIYSWFRTARMVPSIIPSWLWEWGGMGLAFLLAVVMFFLLYRFVSNRWISTRTAFVGALAAGVLWEVARQLFRLYILTVGVYDKIYGPLGILMAMVMFVYYSGLVFIFGAELIRAVEIGSAD
jgi:membrane protein